MQTKISTSTCKYAQTQKRATATTRKRNNARNVKRATYNFVIVKLVRLLSARPAAVSLVAIGSVLPNPL